MISFNDVLDVALHCVSVWSQKSFLAEVTFIRDVFGKITFLMDNTEVVGDVHKQELTNVIGQNMGDYYSGKIYWKKLRDREQKIAEREKMIVEIIERERVEWKNEGNIRFYVSERAIAKKAWINQWENHEPVWPYEEAVAENGTKVIAFYSFKGGMGRTTALAGVALALVEQGKNVLMMDTDIEAPGLATLFFDEEVITRGVLDYLIEQEINHGIRVTDYVLDVTDAALLEENAGQLFLLPAGKVDENYLQKLARIDYQDNRAGYLRRVLAALLCDIRQNYHIDYILIDARAGFHDMGGIAIAQLPHGVVLFGNDSRQSWDGITQALRTIAQGHTEDFPVMLVGSMFPNPVASDFVSVRERFLNKAYTVCLENYYDTDNAIAPGIEAQGEPHFPEFISFNGDLLQGIELFSDGSPERNQRVKAYKSILTGESYKKIAERIKGWFGE